MPLTQSKSKEALAENIATERDAGKPEAQAVAIAESVKRKNARDGIAAERRAIDFARAMSLDAPKLEDELSMLGDPDPDRLDQRTDEEI